MAEQNRSFHNLTFTDGLIFGKALSDKKLLQAFLTHLLGFNVGEVVYVEDQWTNASKRAFGKDYCRGICCVNKDGTVFDIELLPPKNKDVYLCICLYEGYIFDDITDYEETRNGYTILIGDSSNGLNNFARDELCYCLIPEGVTIEPKVKKIVFNVDYEIDNSLCGDLLDYMRSSIKGNPIVPKDNTLIVQMQSKVDAIKQNKSLEASYAKYLENFNVGLAEGRAEGQDA